MEVAGHWRREWAGTAEYGKVTEGGVTRRIARAMEVLNASAPGTQVRVVRAAYHSSAGPGAPAASCVMHSSRRVISSGFNLLDPPTLPSKPMEISSMPMDSTIESHTDGENYKVTEPDDTEISEPSKWKSSTNGSTRMPSEESSSTADNVSIIDLDSRHRGHYRKYSYDSENSDVTRNSSRMSPLLDAPSVLSTLKYKSLLNGNSDWTNRRKSYSFEDTAPLSETAVHSNDILAMESSTDSGICKSSEIVNEPDDKLYDRKNENGFKDWLNKNRPSSYLNKGSHFKSNRQHNVVVEHPLENSIALQSPGKVCITVPIKIDDDYQYKKTHVSEDNDRKIKKVEFCKTELHFAAETGTVNIIATDEKPPPANDFRKRRSAFVPINGTFEKPITLFGDHNKDLTAEFTTFTNSETSESDENTAATKSILKNKIPKPKPYLLGENMAFGSSDDDKRDIYDTPVSAAVSLINKQLAQRRYSDESSTGFPSVVDRGFMRDRPNRTSNSGPQQNDANNIYDTEETSRQVRKTHQELAESVRSKLYSLQQMSPVPGRAKTRQLRDTELTYFGIDNALNTKNTKPKYDGFLSDSMLDDEFRSVKLIQQVSNSVCTSEAESEDAPEYQNFPFKANFAPVPTPRSRPKIESKPTDVRVLKPVLEQDNESNVMETRRSRLRRQDETIFSSRSISEPPKNRSLEKPKPTRRQGVHRTFGERTPSPRSSRVRNIQSNLCDEMHKTEKSIRLKGKETIKDQAPLYENYCVEQELKDRNDANKINSKRRVKEERTVKDSDSSKRETEHKPRSKANDRINAELRNKEISKAVEEFDRANFQKDYKKKKIRTEKLSTPEYSGDNQRKVYDTSPNHKISRDNLDEQNNYVRSQKGHRSRSAQRHAVPNVTAKDAIMTSDSNIKHTTKSSVINGVNEKRKPSNDRTSERKDRSETRHKIEATAGDSNRTTKVRSKVQSSDHTPTMKTESNKPSKRSEYVINYDDKNGTVSSICKVKSEPGTTKKKKIPKEIYKDSNKDYKSKNKIPLLQLPEHQWDPYGLCYADKKWRKRTHVQRTCQLL